MSRIYTTKTPSLKAHIADVRNINAKVIDAKKIKLNGENLEDLLNNTDGKITSVRHPNDNREVITENDLWGSTAEIKDGEIIFHNNYVNVPDAIGCDGWYGGITKVVNNKAYEGNTLYANLETGKLVNGDGMFAWGDKLIVFDSDLSSLVSGFDMFHKCSNLTEFKSNLGSLTNGY